MPNQLQTLHILSPVLALSTSLFLLGCPFFGGGDSIRECDRCDAVFCDANRVATCRCESASPDGGTNYFLDVNTECAALGTTCAVVREPHSQRWEDDFDPGLAVCLDPCESAGEAQCRGEGEAAEWFVCAPAQTSQEGLRDQVVTWVESGGPGTFPNTPPLGWQDSTLDCRDCQSTCGCELSWSCTEGYCLPGGSQPDLVCCGREHGADCPDGEDCEELDGSQGVCETADTCGSCETYADCATGNCYVPEGELSGDCMTATEAFENTYVCHDTENEMWRADHCGNLVERIDLCAENAHCSAGSCRVNAPEIEISPTLLTFDDTPVSTPTTRTLSIGNVGYAPLHVSEIAVDEDEADLFTVSIDEAVIEIDEILDVTVTFTPTAEGSVSSHVNIQSDDADEGDTSVLMNGNGVP